MLPILLVQTTTAAGPPDPPLVPFCEVVKNPEHYDFREVTTTAVFTRFLNATVLADSSCMPAGTVDITTLATFGQDYKPTTVADRKLWEILQRDGEVRVTATGKFHAPSRGPYGAQRCCRMMFEISAVRAAERARKP